MLDHRLQKLRLRDGRALGYAEHGDSEGRAVFWFPGTPSSRLFIPPDARAGTDAASRLGIRLVVLERPGYGISDAVPRRTLLDWPRDVEGAADALGVSDFAVAGFSGGGPYAAATAYALPHRVRRLAVIGSPAPLAIRRVWRSIPRRGRILIGIARHAPALASRLLRLRCPSGEQIQRAMTAHLAPCDAAILANEVMWRRQVALTEEAIRQGYDTWIRELHLAATPWGFRLEDVRVPTDLFWGAHDRTTTLVMAGEYARRIRGARLRVFEDAGHFLHHAHWEEILRAVSEAD